MTLEEALKRLDEIEASDPDPTVDAGAFDLMSGVARAPGGLRLLVERYSGSLSANIVGYLALVLAEVSERSTPETAPLVFDFVGGLRLNDQDGALVSSLGAMKRQLTFGAGWGDAPRPPSSLFPFLRHCLAYSGRHHILVQACAVDVLTALCWGRLLGHAFEPEQLEWLKGRVGELSEIDDDLLADYVDEFGRCLRDGAQAASDLPSDSR